MAGQFQYGVIGAGRQGTAAAYDMAKFGDAARVLLADYDGQAAARAAQRINNLLGQPIAEGIQLDVRDHAALVDALRPLDVALFAVPFIFLLDATRAALEAGTSLVDLGGHTDTVLQQLALHKEAQAANIRIVPDCGMGPGMNNTLGVYAYEQLQAQGATPLEVRLWDGGLPQDPQNVWGYQCSFHINGLTNEYDGMALTLRDGKVTPVETLSELEIVEFEGIGKLEAFVTSGGSSTVPYSFAGKLQVYENKTCRYPGHYAQFRAFKDLGLFREEPLSVNGASITPRQVYHALLAPHVEVERVIDICVMRAQGIGEKAGKRVIFEVDLIDRYDPVTGFTAMERLTGWHAAIMAQYLARETVPAGAYPLEQAIPATEFLQAVRERGFQLTERWV